MATNLLPPPARERPSLSSPLPEMAIQMCENSGQYVWQCECLSPICKCVRVPACVCPRVCVCEGAVIAIFSLASLPFCCLLLLYNFRIRRVNVAASGQASARIGLCMRHLPRPHPLSPCYACSTSNTSFVRLWLIGTVPGMHLNEMPSDLDTHTHTT